MLRTYRQIVYTNVYTYELAPSLITISTLLCRITRIEYIHVGHKLTAEFNSDNQRRENSKNNNHSTRS